MQIEAWNPFSDPNVNVVTGSAKKSAMLADAGILVERDGFIRDLVNLAEDHHDSKNGNGVIVDGLGYTAQTAAAKLRYLEGRGVDLFDPRYPYSAVVTDSVHSFQRETPDGVRTRIVNKHGGSKHKIHKLMDFYTGFADGAVIGTSTGLAQLHSDGTVHVYQVNVDFGTFNPRALDLERFIGDPNISGGFSTQEAFKTGLIEMFPFVPYEIRRVDLQPDLYIANSTGVIVGGSFINQRTFRSEMAADAVNYAAMGRLNLGIV